MAPPIPRRDGYHYRRMRSRGATASSTGERWLRWRDPDRWQEEYGDDEYGY